MQKAKVQFQDRRFNRCRIDRWQLFDARFNPSSRATQEQRALECQVIEERIELGLEAVANLTEDQIIRQYIALMKATLRTNFFQQAGNGDSRTYLSFKLDCARVPSMGVGRPMYEIYVHHREVEGVHLRFGPVARGGLRWSDRDDYRTEVLGLVTTQLVKNVVIVPTGSKGGTRVSARTLHW